MKRKKVKTLKILNLNAWLMPLRLSLHNKKRMDRLFEMIKELNPDVITMQEVWDSYYLDKFAKKLSEYYMLSKPNWLFNESGLVTLTKFPIVSSRLYHFKPTKSYHFFEKRAKKGFFVTRIDAAGKEVDVVNTHLHISNAFTSDKKKKIAEMQYSCIEEFFEKSDKATILCGDLNLDFREVKKIAKVFRIPNKKSITTLNINNHYSNSKRNRTTIDRRQLDYFMYIENGMKINMNVKALKKEKISDHYPIFGEVRFN